MNNIVHDIWNCDFSDSNWLTSTQTLGVLNIKADQESRIYETRTEWI